MRLPTHPIRVWVATRQFHLSDSAQAFLLPDLPVAASAAAFFNGCDPLLEAIGVTP